MKRSAAGQVLLNNCFLFVLTTNKQTKLQIATLKFSNILQISFRMSCCFLSLHKMAVLLFEYPDHQGVFPVKNG